MRAIGDLLGGNCPPPIDIWYNGSLSVDSVTLRYRGSLCKFMDWDDLDHGRFVTFAGLATAMENVCGILEEEQPITGNYLPDDATYGVTYRKMTPIFPSTIIEAEYSRTDAAGTDNLDTGATASASSTTLTCASITTSDAEIGGWIYFTNGSNANKLHYITNSSATSNTITFATATSGAVVAADDFIYVCPPNDFVVDFDATYTGIKSEVTKTSRVDNIVGISTWISAPGIGKVKLERGVHDGLIIANAKFYHQFTMPGTTTLSNAWITGILQA